MNHSPLPPSFIFFFLILLPTAISSTNHTDLLALQALKSAIALDPHGALTSWNQTLHYCSWNGIQCGRRHPDRVVAINLMFEGLVGSLSSHIGNLSFLRTLILQNATFHGPIPPELGLLRRLQYVELSNNSFTGEVPWNLSGCPNLVYLNLIDNELSGTIPDLSFLSKLRHLGLGSNNLSGNIPPSIGNISTLVRLSIGRCGSGLRGEIPESFTNLRTLRYLQLGLNGLTGTVPSGLYNISTIYSLNVATNNLRGNIPSTIGVTLPNIQFLFLLENQFTGPFPASISNASLLQWLYVGGNYFTGRLPRFEMLTHLRYAGFEKNLFEDDMSFISSLTNATKLEGLVAGRNVLTGSLPDSVANLSTHLKFLAVDSNEIHGNIPPGIVNLINLQVLILSGNFLEGSIPTDIGKLWNLHELYLSMNSLGNELPSSLGNLTVLNDLSLHTNNFSGNLPSSIGNCTALLILVASGNSFSGLIPQHIMNLFSLSILLDLSYNKFNGSIPYEVGSLTQLATLDLSNNRLSGRIPSSLGQCRSLQQIYLEGNLLEGEIPSALSALMGLQELDVSVNNLSGPIPNFLGMLDLETLNLSFNKLQGEVPVIGVFANRTSISLVGNERLCGGVEALELPPCSSEKSPKKKLSNLPTILVPVLVTGGICLILLVFFMYKQRMLQRKKVSSGETTIGTQFMRLSYADLVKATGGFSGSNLVGVGKFGYVYKGILDDVETVVAVKVLNLVVRGASKSLIAECNALRGIRHRNLVKILSVCESIDFQGNDFKALVYEFKANGSLEKWLYQYEEQEEGSGGEIRSLSMRQRLNIAVDIAQAIEYLHSGTESSIVHGDLKPSNILLDHEMTACVGDFGLAKIVSDIVPSHEGDSSVGIRGTIGYVPPEYGMSQLVSVQGDVYSYGIVLLEMFTNIRPIDDLFANNLNLHNFVDAALPDRVMEIVDPRLQVGSEMNNDMMKDCVAAVLSIGVGCSKEVPKDRMSMKDVVTELHKMQMLLST